MHGCIQSWSQSLEYLVFWRQVSFYPVSRSDHTSLTGSTARDLTLEAARDASALRKPSTHLMPIPQLKKLLDSRNEREVLEGLRRVIAVHPTTCPA